MLHIVCIVLLSAGICSAARAQDSYDALRLKAAITYKVARFVSWPEGSEKTEETPFVIYVLGDKQVQKAFSSLAGQKLGEREITLAYPQNLEHDNAADIIYVDKNFSMETTALVEKLQRQPILTISDRDDFFRHGGMINLLHKKQRISLAINLVAAQEAQLRISSKLNLLATEIIREKN